MSANNSHGMGSPSDVLRMITQLFTSVQSLNGAQKEPGISQGSSNLAICNQQTRKQSNSPIGNE